MGRTCNSMEPSTIEFVSDLGQVFCLIWSIDLKITEELVLSLRNAISFSNESNVFTCDCPEGYYGSSCEHFNPCSRSPCQHNSTCSNVTSSKYKCLCKPGYTGKIHVEVMVIFYHYWYKTLRLLWKILLHIFIIKYPPFVRELQ